jgi:hypothetical protein
LLLPWRTCRNWLPSVSTNGGLNRLPDIILTTFFSTDVMAGVLIQVPSTTPNACSTTCGDEITCDASSPTSCTYTNSGKTFVAHCKVDFYGNDFAVAQSPDFTTCVQDCADSDRCLAVSFTGGNCYLKDAISQGEYSPAVTGMSNKFSLLFAEN